MSVQRFEFTVGRMPTDEEVNQLFDRYDDMGTRWIPAESQAVIWVDREAPTVLDAVLSAVRDCDAIGLRPVGVVPNGPLGHTEDEDALAAVDLALRFRTLSGRVGRAAAIKTLICS